LYYPHLIYNYIVNTFSLSNPDPWKLCFKNQRSITTPNHEGFGHKSFKI
jgi:hypothetical protein